MRLLLAEDDAQLGRTLTKGLRQEAYAVDVVSDGEHAMHQALVNEYDAIILDIMMPRRDGFSVCRDLRRSGRSTPVLMLTARDTIADKITGLDAGGDDYLTKPFEFAELLARLRALLRRRTTDLLSRRSTRRESAREHGHPLGRSRGPHDRADDEGVRAARISRAQRGTRGEPHGDLRTRVG